MAAQFNKTNLPTQRNIGNNAIQHTQHPGSIAGHKTINLLQSAPTVNFVQQTQMQTSPEKLCHLTHLQQHQQHQQQQSMPSGFYDSIILSNDAASTTTAATTTAATAKVPNVRTHFYGNNATAGISQQLPNSNTILITNNFMQQQQLSSSAQQQQHPIASSASNFNGLANVRFMTAPAASQPAQHVYQINSYVVGKNGRPAQMNEMLQLEQKSQAQQQHQQFYQQQQQQQLQNHDQHRQFEVQPTGLQLQQFFMPADNANVQSSNILPMNDAIAHLSSIVNPVVDRINICINNHYDSTPSPAAPTVSVNSPITLSTIPSCAQSISQPSSPIIPAIQHKPITQAHEIHLNSPTAHNSTTIVDEPDSTTNTTTNPNTPMSTTESDPGIVQQIIAESSTTTTLFQEHPLPKLPNQNAERNISPISIESTDSDDDEAALETNETATSSLCAEAENPASSTSKCSFSMNEDVFVQRQDELLYLGTIMDIVGTQYLVRFDDKSEIWCKAADMKKFGNDSLSETDETQMCVACKKSDNAAAIEICERCDRGYHRNCTTETYKGSGEWICKRCEKSMKALPFDDNEKESCKAPNNQRQLPYHANNLTWDEKHRVNKEQIYCYCGKTGKFDHNMLQCSKCENWFHTQCIQNFKGPLLRGDCFFIFCCYVCNDGKEFLRRFQARWVDVIHLVLYNLSTTKKHQQYKYHHLKKDIWPFTMENMNLLPVKSSCKILLGSNIFKKIKDTLDRNSDRFMCGREIKKDQYLYGLRHNGPPTRPPFQLGDTALLTDEFITQKMKLHLLDDAMANDCVKTKRHKNTESVYTFITDNEDEDIDVDDGDDAKFTSDDEIPIKHIIDKAKEDKCSLQQSTTNNNDTKSPQKSIQKMQAMKTPTKSATHETEEIFEKPKFAEQKDFERSSRKRKAFSVSKTYKDNSTSVNAKRFTTGTSDSSSDENSSSSRCTSLDLMIPAPLNFLGLNNPFCMTSPKKSNEFNSNTANKSKMIKNSFINTNSLDLTNLAAFKSVGLFPTLSANDLAKAAGQPRTVRTIKRRLSAKDITIGPNQEIRRRRTRRFSTNVEIISSTTINPMLSFLPTKDLQTNKFLGANAKKAFLSASKTSIPSASTPTSSSADTVSTMQTDVIELSAHQNVKKPKHGRLLRERPRKSVPCTVPTVSNVNSRRNSISEASTSSSSQSTVETTSATNSSADKTNDLNRSVKEYFGAMNRIMANEPFSIVCKRTLPDGDVQYLVEWGNNSDDNLPTE